MKQKITILGVSVDNKSLADVHEIITKQISQKNNKPLFLITAYSEFFLEAIRNKKFANALEKAAYVLPDGISVLEADDYLRLPKRSVLGEILQGIQIGVKTITGGYQQRTTGVSLVKSLFQHKQYKIFLLGGWNGVSERLAKKYNCGFFEGPFSIRHATDEENQEMIQKVNAYAPEILLVSFGRYNQEIWIAEHITQIRARVIIGVGSAFDEILGVGKWAKKMPSWVDKMGLKWLWRVIIEPSHAKRLIHIPQFAWAVFLQKINS